MDENEQNQMVRMVIIGVSVVVLGLAGWWFFNQSQYAKYFNAKEGIQLNYPKSWTVKENPMPQAIVSFVSPKDNALDTFQENVSVTTTDLSRNPLSMQDYVLLTEDQMTSVFNDVKVQSSESMVLSGHQAHKFIFSVTGENQNMMIVVYAFIVRNTAYNVTYMGFKDRFEQDHQTVKTMMSSFKVFF